MCSRINYDGRVWSSVYIKLCIDYQIAVFFQYKLVLTTISLGESFSDIQFLTGKVFLHRTEKYTMLVMSIL